MKSSKRQRAIAKRAKRRPARERDKRRRMNAENEARYRLAHPEEAAAFNAFLAAHPGAKLFVNNNQD